MNKAASESRVMCVCVFVVKRRSANLSAAPIYADVLANNNKKYSDHNGGPRGVSSFWSVPFVFLFSKIFIKTNGY